jgi:vacuolar-type H+-ATPase subunit E/Vma4
MNVSGNVDHLKKEIQRSYADKLAEFKKQSMKQFDEERKKLEEDHKKKVVLVEEEIKEEEQEMFKSALSEEKLNAKKEFENKREALINEVFDEADKNAKKILAEKSYAKMINAFVKDKDVELVGMKILQKTFPKMAVDDNVFGVIVKQNEQIFDFTFTTFIESRKLDLRHKVSEILF